MGMLLRQFLYEKIKTMKGFSLQKYMDMKVRPIFFLSLWVILLIPSVGLGFEVSARVDRTTMTPEDILNLQVVVEGGTAEVDLSPVKDFRVMSSGTSTSRSYINGKWSHQVAYQYRLIPLKSGTLVIPGLKVSGKDAEVFTDEIRIQVKEQERADTEGRPFFAESEVSRSNPVVGQQIRYTFRLFSAKQFSRASLDTPEFKGFSAKEIEDRKNYDRVINGIAYGVTEVIYILTPEEPGEKTIEPGVVTAQVVVPGSRQDPFGSFFDDPFFNRSPFSTARTRTLRIASHPVEVKVRPLPPHEGSRPFSGLVGKFSLDAVLDKPTLATGESATLTVTIQGAGNIMDAAMPALELDRERFKVYEDAPQEEIKVTEEGTSGRKVFKRALVPLKPGKVKIPALHLTYFDVDQNSYVDLSTPPLEISVSPGAPQGPVLVTKNEETRDNQAPKKDVVLLNRDILDIREDVSILAHHGRPDFFRFLGLVLSPGLVFGLAALTLRHRNKEKSLSSVMVEKAKFHLKQLDQKAVEDEAVLSHLHSALTAAVLSKGNRKGESLTREEVKEILNEKGADSDTVCKVLEMFETLDSARFGGGEINQETIKTFSGKIKRLIQLALVGLIFMTGPGVRELKAATEAVAVPAVEAKAMAAPSPSTESRDRTGLFIQAIKAYREGDFSGAATNFEAIAASGVNNPDLYYDIGNAYFKAHDLGRAILWYERAKKIVPNDPDLVFNLNHARSLTLDKVEEPFSWRDILFFWKGWVSLGWMQAGAVGGSCLFFSWAGFCLFRQRKIFTGPGLILAFLPIFLTLAVGLEYTSDNMVSHAIIVQDVVQVTSGTAPASTTLFDLHAGTRVRVKDRKNGFLKIMLTREKVGWVKPGDAIII